MELTPRFEVIKNCGLTSESGYEDLLLIVDIFKNDFDIELTEENAGVMITHLASAFKRIETGEAVNPLDSALVEQIKMEPVYPLAQKIVDTVLSRIQNELSRDEQDFMLVHVGTLLCEREAEG